MRSSRRCFLLGSAFGLGAGLAGGWLAGRRAGDALPAPPLRDSPDLMPGRYPGHVVEVHDPRSVSADHVVDRPAVDRMADRAVAELVGSDDPADLRGNWGTFFRKGDVVGVKVNPVGLKSGGRPGAVGAVSSPALVVKVVRNLLALGIPPRDVIVFDRYAREFCDAGYADLVERELPGVRWMCAATGYSDAQLDITGFDNGPDQVSAEAGRHVVGYDPDVFTTMGFAAPQHSARDDRRFRSHLTTIVSRHVNKVINLPVLKDHRSAGVTLALKNLSHGMNNNVARSHLAGIAHGFGPEGRVQGPNQCNTFIPQAVSQRRLREKATLHLLDGLVGVYEGGPGMWNRTWATWRARSLFAATDPVALDHVGWDVIDRKRAEMGWQPVARMGWLYRTPEGDVASALAALQPGADPLPALARLYEAENVIGGRGSEAFNVRQPDHIVLAGQLGLGVFDRDRITLRRVVMG